ncbi:MAG: hypothetical protein ABJQ29_11745 [Luteolibacter sp.]
METVVRFHKIEDAYLFRSYLESEDISAYVFDEYLPQNCWIYTQLIGGVRVVVAPEDLETAYDLFQQYEVRVIAPPEVVGMVKLWPLALLVTFVVGVPLMLFGREPVNPETRKP